MQNGWVKQGSAPGDRGLPRKQYRITAAGREDLLERLGTFSEEDAGDDGAFLFRVALFDALPKQKCQVILAARKAFLISRFKQLGELREGVGARSFGSAALDRVQTLVQGELSWVHKLEGQVKSNKGDLKCTPLHTYRATARQS